MRACALWNFHLYTAIYILFLLIDWHSTPPCTWPTMRFGRLGGRSVPTILIYPTGLPVSTSTEYVPISILTRAHTRAYMSRLSSLVSSLSLLSRPLLLSRLPLLPLPLPPSPSPCPSPCACPCPCPCPSLLFVLLCWILDRVAYRDREVGSLSAYSGLLF